MRDLHGQAELLPRSYAPGPAPVASVLTMKVLDLALPGGRVLGLALTSDADGQPEDLVIACGFPGHRLSDLASGVCIPAGALPGLRAALEELAQ